MKRKFLTVLPVALCALCALTAAACDGNTPPDGGNGNEDDTQGLVYTLCEDGQSYSVTGSENVTGAEIVIPSLYKNLPVTEIGENAFRNLTSLTSVTIPESVTHIGVYAFAYSSIASITIPDSVTVIDNYAFEVCTSLASVKIGGGVTSIGMYAFWCCSSLAEVTIPDSVTYISDSAFSYCSSLDSITVGNNNTKYKSQNNCLLSKNGKTLIRGTSSGYIPDGVTSIASAFIGCSPLTSVTIPNSVTSVNWAFIDCASLTSIKFEGTMAQWNKITDGSYWISNTAEYTVTCSDGTIEK